MTIPHAAKEDYARDAEADYTAAAKYAGIVGTAIPSSDFATSTANQRNKWAADALAAWIRRAAMAEQVAARRIRNVALILLGAAAFAFAAVCILCGGLNLRFIGGFRCG